MLVTADCWCYYDVLQLSLLMAVKIKWQPWMSRHLAGWSIALRARRGRMIRPVFPPLVFPLAWFRPLTLWMVAAPTFDIDSADVLVFVPWLPGQDHAKAALPVLCFNQQACVRAK